MIAVVASLQGELVRLRPLRREDAPRLAEIGSHPEVARWWPDITVEELVAKAEGRDEVEAFAIEHDGELVGLGQIYEHSNPEFRHAGIDLFLDPRLHGRGLGRDAVRTLGRWLVEERGHHRVVIDPAAANEKAIRWLAERKLPLKMPLAAGDFAPFKRPLTFTLIPCAPKRSDSSTAFLIARRKAIRFSSWAAIFSACNCAFSSGL